MTVPNDDIQQDVVQGQDAVEKDRRAVAMRETRCRAPIAEEAPADGREHIVMDVGPAHAREVHGST